MLTTDDFNYELPDELIAQYPLPERTASRLLVVNRDTQQLEHRIFSDIIDFIHADDLLILNDTKVIPARLFGVKQSGGQVECLIERVLNEREALAHIRSSKSPKAGARLCFEGVAWATVLGRCDELFQLRFDGQLPVLDLLEKFGHIPLPPYITRRDVNEDRERYQTVFAQKPGAVAAPTASLHFSDTLLGQLQQRGTAIAHVTLHVGAGTFQPVRVKAIEEHVMHREWIDVPQRTIDAMAACKARAGRVIAVGTTAMRALQTCTLSGTPRAYQGETDIFIYPGFEFRGVDALITNFHLPKSTLLMLVSAFTGLDLTRHAYRAAIEAKYRFFSYGDAMFIT